MLDIKTIKRKFLFCSLSFGKRHFFELLFGKFNDANATVTTNMKILNLLILLSVIAVNALANILPINGVNTGEVSALYDNYFTPAGFAFGIWSLIYLGLLVFTAYQSISKQFKTETIGYWFIINGLANIGWIMAWHHSYFYLTMLLMVVLLWTLAVINLRIKDESNIVKVPFQIYFGWIGVATIANASVLLKYLSWDHFGVAEMYWGIALVSIAGVLGIVLIMKNSFLLSGLAIAWGVYGIYSKQVTLDRAVIYQYICLAVVVCLILAGIVQGVRIAFKTSPFSSQ